MRALVVATIAVIAVAGAGCGKKGQSAKMRDLYHCWEIGWQIVSSCYERRGTDCDAMSEDWFETNKTGVTVLDSNAAFATEKEKCARTTGIGVWNQLSADDITDDMADALQALQAAVKSHDLDAIRPARARVRELLDLAP